MLDCATDEALVQNVQKVIDRSKALEYEGALVKLLDSVTDKTLLYDGALNIDKSLKHLKVLTAADVLHPTLNKRLEQILN